MRLQSAVIAEVLVPGLGVRRPSKLSLEEGIRVLYLPLSDKRKDLKGHSNSRRRELSGGSGCFQQSLDRHLVRHISGIQSR